LGGPLLRVRDGDRDEILEHRDVIRVDDTWIDLDLAHAALPVGLDGHHAAAGGAGYGLVLEALLNLLQPPLHLLGLLHESHDVVGHARESNGVDLAQDPTYEV